MSTEFDLFDEIGMESDEPVDDLSLEGTDAEELPEEASESVEAESEEIEDTAEDEDEDAVVDGTAELRDLVREMHTELQELRAQLNEAKTADGGPAEPTEIDFVDDETFDRAVSSRDGLNKLLNVVHQAGHASAMQMLPALVKETAEKIFTQKMLVESFYRSNPDLDKIRPVVQQVAKEVEAAMPGEKDAKKILLEIARRSRERAKAGGGSGSKVTSTKHKNPGNVSRGSGRPGNGRPVKSKPSVADDIQKMLSS